MFPRTKDIRLSVIKQIEQKASEYPDVISLAQGIPSFDTPQCIKGRAANALSGGQVAKYSLSPGLPELRELIEISLARQNMFYDYQNEIIVTAGSIEGLTAAVLAITSPGDEIIIPEPTYTSYRELIILAGCNPVMVPLDEDRGWAFDIGRFAEAVTKKTRAILYCNPNNPTGTIISRESLVELAELARAEGLYLIADEVYKDFPLLDGADGLFSLAELSEYRDFIIRVFSFSKAYAMTGWRVGYLHGPEKAVREILKVHDSLVTCAPVISQFAAMGALEMGEKELSSHRQIYRQRRDLIVSRFKHLTDYFSWVEPQGAYYIFPKIIRGMQDSWRFAIDLIEKANVAVVPGVAFGPSGEGHVRLNFGRSEQDIIRAMDRIAGYCQDHM